MSESGDDYEKFPTLFFNKGFSKNWNDIDLRKKNTYGFPGLSEQAVSEYVPDLDYDDVDLADGLKEVSFHTEEPLMEEPEEKEEHSLGDWKRFKYDLDAEEPEVMSQILVAEDIQEIQSDDKPASVHTPQNKHLLSNESSEMKNAMTLAVSKDLLREKIDDESHVKNCINRKDVVIKSILRSMRKYYADLVQDNSEYKRKIRNIKLKHKTLINCCYNLAEMLGLSDCNTSVAFYLSAIAFPTDLRKILKKSISEFPENKAQFSIGLKAIERIESAMTRYNKRVMKEFIGVPEICYLLLHYISKMKNEDYGEFYKLLKEMANETLDLCSKGSLTSVSTHEGKIIEIIK
jgi:hypothetical protein